MPANQTRVMVSIVTTLTLAMLSACASTPPQSDTAQIDLSPEIQDNYKNLLVDYQREGNHKSMWFIQTANYFSFFTSPDRTDVVSARRDGRDGCWSSRDKSQQKTPSPIVHDCTEINEDQTFVAPGWFSGILSKTAQASATNKASGLLATR